VIFFKVLSHDQPINNIGEPNWKVKKSSVFPPRKSPFFVDQDIWVRLVEKIVGGRFLADSFRLGFLSSEALYYFGFCFRPYSSA